MGRASSSCVVRRASRPAAAMLTSMRVNLDPFCPPGWWDLAGPARGLREAPIVVLDWLHFAATCPDGGVVARRCLSPLPVPSFSSPFLGHPCTLVLALRVI